MKFAANNNGTIKGTPLTLRDIASDAFSSPTEVIDWINNDQIVLKTIDSIRIVNISSMPFISKLYKKEKILVSNSNDSLSLMMWNCLFES